MPKLRVGVLVSHNGSNLRALHLVSLQIDAQFEIVAVISNNSGSLGLAYARENEIPTRHLSGKPHPIPTNSTTPSAPCSSSTRSTWSSRPAI
ncbi:formyltransferase family protein [Nocardia sp. NPDC049707]|uniref:formyltransferase family protein n=1 Tax=Nocardia sp. NPDC049707 TaxID=3154735 RepID=UPI0034258388